jgi:hypothetical protein
MLVRLLSPRGAIVAHSIIGLAAIVLRRARMRPYHGVLIWGSGVAIILRTIFIAGLGMMIVLPLSAMNGSMDSLLPGIRVPKADTHPAWGARLDASSAQVMARLYSLKAEIRADMCRRGEQPYCFAGICLPSARYGCAPDLTTASGRAKATSSAP